MDNEPLKEFLHERVDNCHTRIDRLSRTVFILIATIAVIGIVDGCNINKLETQINELQQQLESEGNDE